MKKTVLLLLAAGTWLFAGAQNNAKTNHPASKCISVSQIYQQRMHRNDAQKNSGKITTPFYTQGVHARNTDGSNARTEVGTGTHVGTAYNVYGVLDASTTAVTANQATNLIVMTHREDMGKPYGSGAYEPSFSSDMGVSWDSSIVMFKGESSRYPNGVIFNPAGNTTPTMAYDVVAGPWTNSSASTISWVKTVYGNVRLDNSNLDTLILSNGNPGVLTQNTGNLSFMTSCDDSSVHVIGAGWNENGAQTAFTSYLGGILTTGKFDKVSGNKFIWSQQSIRPHFWDGFKGATASSPYDSLAEVIGSPGTAWSQDGQTGYVVFFGNLDSAGFDFASYQPIVYKSTDAGKTWNMMPPFDYSTLPNLVKYLPSTADGGSPLPIWNLIGHDQGDENDYDLVVDKNNNLHIMGSVEGMYYANPDSAYNIYTFVGAKYYIYDVYNTTPTGGWQARFIDSLRAIPADTVVTGSPWLSSGSSNIAYGARIQASRTTDGSKIFCTWEDDVIGDAEMLYPDVFGQGYDIDSARATKVYQFTNTIDQYFLCVSDKVLTSGSKPNTVYTIPCVYVASPGNNDGTSPVEFLYQGNVVYGDTSFIPQGINEIAHAGFSVSDNYPNPFNKTTQFNITLDKASTVGVDVFNMIGEKVWSTNSSRMTPGTHVITINNSGMNAGMYFYRVTVNNQTVTHKMIVQ